MSLMERFPYTLNHLMSMTFYQLDKISRAKTSGNPRIINKVIG